MEAAWPKADLNSEAPQRHPFHSLSRLLHNSGVKGHCGQFIKQRGCECGGEHWGGARKSCLPTVKPPEGQSLKDISVDRMAQC